MTSDSLGVCAVFNCYISRISFLCLMMSKVRIGVVGAGVFGSYHANKCAINSRVDFIGIYDPDYARATNLAQMHKAVCFKAYRSMLDKVDAVIIACPAIYHGGMAVQALKAGRHCLIEKPLAASLQEAADIVDLSVSKDLVVQAGHQERFVIKAAGLDKVPETPRFIQGFRMGKYAVRGTDVSVTLDLMTHDLDLVLWQMRAFPDTLKAQTRSLHSSSPDETHVELEFARGRAELTASRISEDFTRTMEIQYPSGIVHLDFNAKKISHDTPFDLNIDFAAEPAAKDSLMAGLDSFTAAILTGTPPAISGHDGYEALRLALMIDEVGVRKI